MRSHLLQHYKFNSLQEPLGLQSNIKGRERKKLVLRLQTTQIWRSPYYNTSAARRMLNHLLYTS